MHSAFKTPLLFASSILLLAACGARTNDDVGGKTSWLSSCDRDSDCADIEGAECIQKLCTKACETNSCGQVAGTQCVAPAQSCLSASSCLPTCEDSNDCARFGAELTCQDAVCVQLACAFDASVQPFEEASATSVEVDAMAVVDSTAANSLTATTADSGERDENATTSGTTSSAQTSDVPSQSGPADSGSSNPESETDAPLMPPSCPSEVNNPSQRPHLDFWQREDDEPLDGETACEGLCGYVYDAFEYSWQYEQTLVCPLALNECSDLKAALDQNPARCNTVDDCIAYQADLITCEPSYTAVRYFDSALFTADERQAREAILRQIEERGCRELFDGWDGPAYALGCENNLCTLVTDGDCFYPGTGGAQDAAVTSDGGQ